MTYQEIVFPLKGLNVVTEFELQPALTTPSAENVRGFEPLTLRGRGGARPGLSQYVPQQLPTGPHLIQHLNVVVDPTVLALITTFNDFDPDHGVADPSSNNGPIPRQPTPARRIRVGGSGLQPNRHVGADQQPPQQESGANWYAGTVVSGPTLGTYAVSTPDLGTIDAAPLTASDVIPAGAGVLVVFVNGGYYIQPQFWGE